MADGEARPTTFRLEVDLGAVTGDPAEELGRILRYWAGNMKHYNLGQATAESVFDSEYREVGRWALS